MTLQYKPGQLDLIVVIAYLLLIFIAGMWLTRRAGMDHPLVLVADQRLVRVFRHDCLGHHCDLDQPGLWRLAVFTKIADHRAADRAGMGLQQW